MPSFTRADTAQLEDRGIALSEATRQLALLREPPAPTCLLRPCTPGDGIEVLPETRMPELHAEHAEAARQGRFTKFVPASGAASRMFADLAKFRSATVTRADVVRRAGEGDRSAAEVLTFLDHLDGFPFADALLRATGGGTDDVQAILDALLDEDGLDYGNLPKGLIPFHRYGDDVRTAFEEHLVEAAAYARDGRGTCRLHFTVSSEHRARFDDILREVRGGYQSAFGVRLEVGFSTQEPSTDTLALDPRGAPFRRDDGTLLLRPGGHGALLHNLNALGAAGADLVFVKNIDNVVPDRLRGPTVTWKKAIAGRLLQLERRAHGFARLLATGQAADSLVEEAEAFCRDVLHAPPAAPGAVRRAALLERLRRPLRVCGVVPNTGEPGGGPFWVRGEDGTVSLQIVEGAQIDAEDPQQARIYASSTHFSPTDLVCALRDPDGHPHDLADYVDPRAVLLARKTHEGRPLLALERPGLWNGAMARWNTVFVEVPLSTFTPVKTVNDLLRPEHQPA
jgi:hypothetical protein